MKDFSLNRKGLPIGMDTCEAKGVQLLLPASRFPECCTQELSLHFCCPGPNTNITRPVSGDMMWYCKQTEKFMKKKPQNQADLEDMEFVKADQCMLGLKDVDNGLPHQKATAFLTASRQVKLKLSAARCDGLHEHQQLDTKKRCQRAQEWPPELCKAILEGWIEELGRIMTMVAFPAEADVEIPPSIDDDDEERPILDGILSYEDLAVSDNSPDYLHKKDQEQHEVKQDEEIAPPEPIGEPAAVRRERWRRNPYNMRVALRRLHHMTGHASTSAMQRLLRTAGAAPAAVRALEYFRCPTCEDKKDPHRPPPTKPPEDYKFNKAISLDVFIARTHTATSIR